MVFMAIAFLFMFRILKNLTYQYLQTKHLICNRSKFHFVIVRSILIFISLQFIFSNTIDFSGFIQNGTEGGEAVSGRVKNSKIFLRNSAFGRFLRILQGEKYLLNAGSDLLFIQALPRSCKYKDNHKLQPPHEKRC